MAAILLISWAQMAGAQDLSLFEKRILVRGSDTLRYRVLYPYNYKKGKSYPLILFLHGSGERGSDNEAQLVHGGKLFVRENVRRNFRAIVLFPQCPKDSFWARAKRIPNTPDWVFSPEQPAPVPQQLVKILVDSLADNHIVNSRRLYIGGLSMGGMGTYEMLGRYPGYFKAAFPICGACNIPWYLANAEKIPMWIFHGALDDVVSPQPDRELFKALMTRGIPNVMYTEYPKANHNSWDAAFAEPKLLPWLFSDRKRRRN
ncbi:phospholipase [Sediminibacterium sp. WSJ-3]|nr:phospholipase [Sediminibacterium soli]